MPWVSSPSLRRALEAFAPLSHAYRDVLFYFPGSLTEVCLDVFVGRFSERRAAKEICFEGTNVLYNKAGDGYFEWSDEIAPKEHTRESLPKELAKAAATPTFRPKVSYVGRRITDDTLLVPWALNLQRIAVK